MQYPFVSTSTSLHALAMRRVRSRNPTRPCVLRCFLRALFSLLWARRCVESYQSGASWRWAKRSGRGRTSFESEGRLRMAACLLGVVGLVVASALVALDPASLSCSLLLGVATPPFSSSSDLTTPPSSSPLVSASCSCFKRCSSSSSPNIRSRSS